MNSVLWQSQQTKTFQANIVLQPFFANLWFGFILCIEWHCVTICMLSHRIILCMIFTHHSEFSKLLVLILIHAMFQHFSKPSKGSQSDISAHILSLIYIGLNSAQVTIFTWCHFEHTIIWQLVKLCTCSHSSQGISVHTAQGSLCIGSNYA